MQSAHRMLHQAQRPKPDGNPIHIDSRNILVWVAAQCSQSSQGRIQTGTKKDAEGFESLLQMIRLVPSLCAHRLRAWTARMMETGTERWKLDQTVVQQMCKPGEEERAKYGTKEESLVRCISISYQ